MEGRSEQGQQSYFEKMSKVERIVFLQKEVDKLRGETEKTIKRLEEELEEFKVSQRAKTAGDLLSEAGITGSESDRDGASRSTTSEFEEALKGVN